MVVRGNTSAQRPLSRLPKSHLHIHADGSYPRGAVNDLAAKRGVVAPRPPEQFGNTDEFFEEYAAICQLPADLADLAALSQALVVEEATHGVAYLEVGVEPQMYAPRLGSLDDILAAMIDGYRGGSEEVGIEVGCMVGVNTDQPVSLADEVAEAAQRRAGDGVVAFGTAGFVEPAGLSRFRPAVARARASGLRIVSHAGQVGGAESVREALDELQPDRIAHGINAVRDQSVLDRLASEGVVCDVCVTSNVLLGMVPSYEEHPLPRMLQAGVRVTLNADDEYWFGSSIVQEYERARDTFGLTDEQIAEIARTGTRRTGMSEKTRRVMLDGITAWLGDGDSAS
jgi:adenosine deaminase